jgi:transcriptional regulator with XRE-family HTH domain
VTAKTPTDRYREEVAERLRRAREAAGFDSPVEFAARADVNLNTYYSHENGNRPIGEIVALHYAKFLNISPSVLLYGDSLRLPETVTIIGALGEGGRVTRMHRKNNTTRHIQDQISGGMVGIVVEGDDNSPAYQDGDTVLFRPLREGYYRGQINNVDCVVRLKNRDVMIARVTIEHDLSVTLRPYRAPIMRRAEIRAAEPIVMVIKRKPDHDMERVAA